jgi:hypothetical protein
VQPAEPYELDQRPRGGHGELLLKAEAEPEGQQAVPRDECCGSAHRPQRQVSRASAVGLGRVVGDPHAGAVR